jgi:diphosphomevalonate decarboxylase
MSANRYASIFPQLQQDYQDILLFLNKAQYIIEPIVKQKPAINNSGEAFSSAYPIQGLLKYHGMANPQSRIAMFPSISVCNGAFQTISYVKIDSELIHDRLILNGVEKSSDTSEFRRVKFQIEQIQKYANISSRFLVISRNFITETLSSLNAKGIGTSASGGAAIAKAMLNILYDNAEITKNARLLSVFSRYLSGSASRSSVGGMSLWLNHPKCNTWESFAIRLDQSKDQDFIKNISLITIPLESTLTTSSAHEIALSSPLYRQWCISRKSQILQFLEAFLKHDFRTIGALAEQDSRMLHEIHITAPGGRPYWNEKTYEVISFTEKMRNQGIPLYFSIDTGPSVVLIAQRKNKDYLVDQLKKFVVPELLVTTGSIQGPSKLIRSTSNLYHLLDDDIAKFQ